MEGYTSFTRREAVGVIGSDHAVELPADDGHLEDRPGAGGRQHDRAEAGRDHTDHHAEARRTGGRDPAEGRAEHRQRPRRADGPGADHATPRSTWSRSPARCRRASTSRGPRRTRSSASTSSWAARPRWSCSTTSASRSALETIAGTGYYNAGQDCTAATRVLAEGRVYDDVVSGLAGQAKGLVIGDTLSPETTLGPVNSANQRERVDGLPRAPAGARGGRDGREAARSARLLPRADGGRGAGAGRRDDPEARSSGR